VTERPGRRQAPSGDLQAEPHHVEPPEERREASKLAHALRQIARFGRPLELRRSEHRDRYRRRGSAAQQVP